MNLEMSFKSMLLHMVTRLFGGTVAMEFIGYFTLHLMYLTMPVRNLDSILHSIHSHFAENKAFGVMKPGHCFTIEPMISEGSWRDITWPDDWTAVTEDGKRSAQFEQTFLGKFSPFKFHDI